MKTIILHRESVYCGPLILVNNQYRYMDHPCGIKCKQESIPLSNLKRITKPGEEKRQGRNRGVYLLNEAAVQFNKLINSVNGWTGIVPVSGWRSFREQQEIWDKSVKEQGMAFTKQFVALPGHSEHQTGLAVDVALKSDHIDYICPDFPYEGICQEFRSHAEKYGFVERYPQAKQQITGIGWEPWHFRYVGVPHAEIMDNNDLVLEEYIDYLRRYPYGKKEVCMSSGGILYSASYLPAAEEKVSLLVGDNTNLEISGNNIDGWIVTEKQATDKVML